MDTDSALEMIQHAIPVSGHSVAEQMMVMALQLSILIFAAQIGGKIMQKLRMPSVLGELGAGIVVGPYLLGHLSIPFLPIFSHGIFPLPDIGAALSVSSELYGFATIASLILLFMAGLETDIRMFMRYSLAGTLVGLGGAIFSFAAGMCIGPIFLGKELSDPVVLFLGVLCMATSVGITARILSDKRKMDSSEGVTIIAGAVIDDVIGIIGLAIVMGIVGIEQAAEVKEVPWMKVIWVGITAIGTWLFFTILGLVYANHLSRFLKSYRHTTTMVTAALGITLFISAIFECAGLAMIIGAYIMGLSLSKTDLKFLLMEKIHDFQAFFVPIFFAVMGALVDVRMLFEWNVLMVGLIYAALAIVAKVFGCALPAMCLNFNLKGALRIGLGMVPRGEVALIIAGIGVSAGILSQEIFGIAIIMTLVTTLVAPPALAWALEIPGRGTKKDDSQDDDLVITKFSFPQVAIGGMVVERLRQCFELEGFFVTLVDADEQIYQMRKDNAAFSMQIHPLEVDFISPPPQVYFIKTVVYETLLSFLHSLDALKEMNKPEDLRQEMASAVKDSGAVRVDKDPLAKAIRPDCIRMHLYNTQSKKAVVQEMVNILGDAGVIEDREALCQAIMEREEQISTGLQDGVAIPHARTDDVNDVRIAIGISREGMDFDALDQKPTQLIILIVSPANHAGAHLQTLAAVGSIAIANGFMNAILSAKNVLEVRELFIQKK